MSLLAVAGGSGRAAGPVEMIMSGIIHPPGLPFIGVAGMSRLDGQMRLVQPQDGLSLVAPRFTEPRHWRLRVGLERLCSES